jgi:3'-phosphoadenosine 5'-phosphosulfate sulfotransferase (PAPS reductase)/FAD synthetase
MDGSLDIPIEWVDSQGFTPSAFDPNEYLKAEQQKSFEKFDQAVIDIKAIRRHYITICATSFGKDSSVLLLAALKAHMELMEEGMLDSESPFILTHVNTLVENHLMIMVSRNECDRLSRYCQINNINLDLRIGTPPLEKQWAALFLSGKKIISSARSNNDCSLLMKRDVAGVIERNLEKQYGSETVTLLGVRLDESVARKHKMQISGTDKRSVYDILDKTDKGEMVFAPIKTMSDDDIWTILRCAGSDPITQPIDAAPIPSYAPNHRLLHIVYSDSKEGSCPTTAKRVKGEKDGGCGGSARTGCNLCAKQVVDKSGEAQAKLARHAAISSNIIRVRNYIIYVAQDISYRTYHSRAVHQPTGALGLQPNVLNSQTIDKLIWLLSQASVQDAQRAKRFSKLAEANTPHLDEGYADIINDTELDERDRAVLAEVYLKYAQENLIQPMNFELAVYLSAIHSRDGVRLPPNRAIYIWDQVSKGARVPYPDVNPKDAKIDDIPDAIMIIPSEHVSIPALPTLSTFDHEGAGGCTAQEKDASALMPASHATFFIGESEEKSKQVAIRSLSVGSAGEQLKATIGAKKVIRHKASKRSIKKVSKKGGKYKVLERGRTSLDTPSFGKREPISDFHVRALESVPLYQYDKTTTFDLLVEDDDEQSTGYHINHEHLFDWEQFDGLQRALDEHNRFVEFHTKFDGHFYFYGGTDVFMSLERYGVIRFNERAKQHTLRILQRTAYFNALGLFALDEEGIVALANSESTTPDTSIASFRPNIKSDVRLGIEQVLNMKQFRQYFAKQLLELRKERNQNRAKAKALVTLAAEQPTEALHSILTTLWAKFKPVYQESAIKQAYAKTLVKKGIEGFDGDNYHNWLTLTEGNMRYMEHYFADQSGYLSLLDKAGKKLLSGDAARLASIKVLSQSIINEMCRIRESAHKMKVGTKGNILLENVLLEPVNSIILNTKALNINQQVVNATVAW